jgi:hypothetical protein
VPELRLVSVKQHPAYQAWKGMKYRCYNPNSAGWKNYGGRGITVCERWRDCFDVFAADMGAKPGPNYSVDRIDNDGPYAPWNCRWATRSQQAINRRQRRGEAFCGRGHPMSGDNLYLWRGKRNCKACRRERKRVAA